MSESGLSVQLFIGCPIHSELRMHLRYSDAWKQQKLTQQGAFDLKELQHDNKEFLGFLIDRSDLSIDSIRELERDLKEAIAEACPEMGIEPIKAYIFPQIYLS